MAEELMTKIRRGDYEIKRVYNPGARARPIGVTDRCAFATCRRPDGIHLMACTLERSKMTRPRDFAKPEDFRSPWVTMISTLQDHLALCAYGARVATIHARALALYGFMGGEWSVLGRTDLPTVANVTTCSMNDLFVVFATRVSPSQTVLNVHDRGDLKRLRQLKTQRHIRHLYAVPDTELFAVSYEGDDGHNTLYRVSADLEVRRERVFTLASEKPPSGEFARAKIASGGRAMQLYPRSVCWQDSEDAVFRFPTETGLVADACLLPCGVVVAHTRAGSLVMWHYAEGSRGGTVRLPSTSLHAVARGFGYDPPSVEEPYHAFAVFRDGFALLAADATLCLFSF